MLNNTTGTQNDIYTCHYTWEELLEEWSSYGDVTGSSDVTNAVIHVLGAISLVLNCTSFIAYWNIAFPQSCFLQNLAVADAVLPIAIIFGQWLPPFTLIDRCHVTYGCVYFFTILAVFVMAAMSLLSLLGLVTNHAIAIIYPLNYYDMLSFKRTSLAIACLWSVPYLSTAAIVIYAVVVHHVSDIDPDEPFCETMASDDVISAGKFLWLALAVLVIGIIVGLYIKIYLVASRSTSWNSRFIKSGQDVKRNMRAVKTTAFLLLSLVLSWCFIVTCMAAITYGLDDSMHYLALDMFNIWLLINSISDPIIVGVRSANVQVAYRQLFKCCLSPRSGRKKSPSVTTISSYL